MLFSQRGLLKRNKSFIAREGRLSSLSAPKGGGPQPPDLANLVHWYDFTDTSVLWQDTGATTAVAAVDDPIGRCDDQGTRGDNCLQSTDINRPLWKGESGLPGGAYVDAGASRNFEGIADTDGFLNGNFTVAGAYNHHASAFTEYAWTWDTFDAWIQKNASNVVNLRIVNSSVKSVVDVNSDQLVLFWCSDNGANSQRGRLSFDAGVGTTSATSAGNGPTTAGLIGIGGWNGNNNPMRGEGVLEWLAWSGTPSEAEIEDYLVAKHGGSWT